MTSQVESRWLAAQLKSLRLAAGWLQQSQVAAALGWQRSKLSMLESRQRPVHDADLATLLDLYNVPRPNWDRYLDAATIAQRREWWERDFWHSQEEQLRLYTGYEQGASLLRTYQPGVPHGLLQTRAYTDALLRQRVPEISDELVDHLVAHRSKRQEVLDDPQPLKLHMVIDEAVIHRLVGDQSVMAAQLSQLAEVATISPHVTIQLMPFDRQGAFAAQNGPFTILGFPPDKGTGVVFIEHRKKATFLEDLEDLDEYSALFRQLSDLALSPKDSRQQVSSLSHQLYGNGNGSGSP